MKQINYMLLILLILITQYTKAENLLDSRCIPCSTTQGAVFCNASISDELCVGGDIHDNGNLDVCGTTTLNGPVVITNPTQSTNCGNGALTVAGGVGIGGNLNVCGSISTSGGGIIINPTGIIIPGTGVSTSCTNGALVIGGGVGVGGNLNVCGSGSFGGPVIINNTTQSFSCSEGALVVAGGVGIAGNLNVCGSITATGGISFTGPLVILDTTESTSCSNGAIAVPLGGVGIGGNLNVCGLGHFFNPEPSTGCSSGALVIDGGVGIGGDLNVCGQISASSFSGPGIVINPTGIVITGTGASTSCTSGALVVNGGVGIGGDLNVCGTINASGFNGPQMNYLEAFSTLPQTVATPSVFQNAVFSTVAVSDGWTINAGSNLVCPKTGLYLVSYTAEFQVTTVQIQIAMKAVLDGVDVDDSYVVGFAPLVSTASGDPIWPLSKTFIVDAVAGQVLNIQFTGAQAITSIVGGIGTGTSTFKPSVSVSISYLR